MAIITIQQSAIDHHKKFSTYWYRAYKDTLHWYTIAYNRLHSPRQRKLEKAYRAQCKREYRILYANKGLHHKNEREYIAGKQKQLYTMRKLAGSKNNKLRIQKSLPLMQVMAKRNAHNLLP